MFTGKRLQMNELSAKTIDELTKMVHELKKEGGDEELQAYIATVQQVLDEKLTEKMHMHKKRHDHGSDIEK